MQGLMVVGLIVEMLNVDVQYVKDTGAQNTGLPSLTRFACDTREYVFSHAHTQMNENHMRIGKLAEKC